jgi:hypothetical protein
VTRRDKAFLSVLKRFQALKTLKKTVKNALECFVMPCHALSRYAKYALEKRDKVLQSVSQRFKTF